jgi:hypothetical protein
VKVALFDGVTGNRNATGGLRLAGRFIGASLHPGDINDSVNIASVAHGLQHPRETDSVCVGSSQSGVASNHWYAADEAQREAIGVVAAGDAPRAERDKDRQVRTPPKLASPTSFWGLPIRNASKPVSACRFGQRP